MKGWGIKEVDSPDVNLSDGAYRTRKKRNNEPSTNSSEQHRPREEFNVDRFHDQLVRFIVADDQVSPWCTPNDVCTSHCFISLGD